MKPRIIIIGGGQYSNVVADAIIAANKYELIGFTDTKNEVGKIIYRQYKVVATQDNYEELKKMTDYFIVGLGNNQHRKMLFEELKNVLQPATIIHPSCVVSPSFQIHIGTVCLANAVINANSFIGDNTIINSGVIIDHDCKIGNHVHLSIGSTIGSNSIIADFTTIKIGESIPSFSTIN